LIQEEASGLSLFFLFITMAAITAIDPTTKGMINMQQIIDIMIIS